MKTVWHMLTSAAIGVLLCGPAAALDKPAVRPPAQKAPVSGQTAPALSTPAVPAQGTPSSPQSPAIIQKAPAQMQNTPTLTKQPGMQMMQIGTIIRVDPASGPYHGDTHLNILLLGKAGVPLAGKSVKLVINNVHQHTIQTGPDGKAGMHFHIPPDLTPGTYPVEARFAGDNTAAAGGGRGTLTVEKADTAIELNGHLAHQQDTGGGLRKVYLNVGLSEKITERMIWDRLIDNVEVLITAKPNPPSSSGNTPEAKRYVTKHMPSGGAYNLVVAFDNWPELKSYLFTVEYPGNDIYKPSKAIQLVQFTNPVRGKIHILWKGVSGADGATVPVSARAIIKEGEPTHMDFYSDLAEGAPGTVVFEGGSCAPAGCRATTDSRGFAACNLGLHLSRDPIYDKEGKPTGEYDYHNRCDLGVSFMGTMTDMEVCKHWDNGHPTFINILMIDSH